MDNNSYHSSWHHDHHYWSLQFRLIVSSPFTTIHCITRLWVHIIHIAVHHLAPLFSKATCPSGSFNLQSNTFSWSVLPYRPPSKHVHTSAVYITVPFSSVPNRCPNPAQDSLSRKFTCTLAYPNRGERERGYGGGAWPQWLHDNYIIVSQERPSRELKIVENLWAVGALPRTL